jgi:S1-C subfamily serine protease
VTSSPAFGSPAYAAGLDVDDELRQLDGAALRSLADVTAVLQRHKPGDTIAVVFTDRTGASKTTQLTLGEDPSVEIVPIESAGGTLTDRQRAFRQRWLN